MIFSKSVPVLLASLTSVAYAVNTVEVRGQDFVDTVTNKRVMIIGVDYQPGGQAGYNPEAQEDALSDAKACLRDAAILQRLGINTIRVYNTDPRADHDECMSIWNTAGIYVIIDVNSPLAGESLDRSDPASSYHVGYLKRVFGVVEAFKAFPNVMGFFSANEVMNDIPTSKDNPPYIRAIQRDLKNYIKNHADRPIPVGYSAADVRPILQDQWEYLQCALDGEDDNVSSSDFFGVNSYSWCGGDATFETAGYDDLVEIFGNSTIPVFFSEYGCNEVQPRVFEEVGTIYGTKMTSLSGGLVYEYSQEEHDFGLVTINGNNSVSLMVDFDNLQGQFNDLDLGLLQSTNPEATSLRPPRCNRNLITNDMFSKSFDIPDTPDDVQDLINNGLSNPNRGELVEIGDLKVPYPVYASNGQEITGLAVKPVRNGQSNVPSGEDTSPSGTASGAKPTKTNAADAIDPSLGSTSSLFVAMLLMFGLL